MRAFSAMTHLKDLKINPEILISRWSMAMQQLWQGLKWPCLLHRSFEYVYPMVHPVEAHFDVSA